MKRMCNSEWRVAIGIGLLACAVGLVGCPNGFKPHYIVDIERDFATQQEKNLIFVAENTYPSREEVAAVYPAGTNPQDLPEEVWWYFGDFGNDFRLPYAITTGAIEFYLQMVLEDEANRVLPELAPFPGAVERFKYTATIKYFTTFEGEGGEVFSNVYVVTMGLHWSESAGPLTGHGFDLARKVVLTPAGEVLQVQGDGELAISIS